MDRDPWLLRVERSRAFGAFDGFWPTLAAAAAFLLLLFSCGGLGR